MGEQPSWPLALIIVTPAPSSPRISALSINFPPDEWAVRASRGKQARAEPVASLYEQRRVRHVGAFAELEDQMYTFVPATAGGRHDFDGSPDRVDALVCGR